MLAPSFDAIDLDVSGGITFAEMRNALGGLATDSQLRKVIAALDSNNDGQLTKLELIKGGTDYLSKVKSGTDNLTQLSDVVGTGTTGLAGVNANLDGVAKDDTLTNEAKGAKWAKNTALAVNAVGKGVVPWMPEIVTRLYEIARFTAKGNDKPLNSQGRVKFWKKGNIPHDPFAGFAQGGIIPGYAGGGMIGNGIFNQDSVLARYASGGSIMLAGGEGVINANAARSIGPSAIELMNNTGRLPGSGSDNGPHFTRLGDLIHDDLSKVMRVLVCGFSTSVEEGRENTKALASRLENLERRIRVEGSREPRRQTKMS